MRKSIIQLFVMLTLCSSVFSNELNVTAKVESGTFTSTLPAGVGTSINWLSITDGYLRLGTVRTANISMDTVVMMFSAMDSLIVGTGLTTFRALLNSGYLQLTDTATMLSGYLRLGNQLLKDSSGYLIPRTGSRGLNSFADINSYGNLTALSGFFGNSLTGNVGSFSNLSSSGLGVYIRGGSNRDKSPLFIADYTGDSLINITSGGIFIFKGINGTISTPAQPNITSVGQLSNLSVSGTIQGGTFSGTVTGHASLDLPLTGGTLSGSLTATGTVTASTVSQSTSFISQMTTSAVNDSLTVLKGKSSARDLLDITAIDNGAGNPSAVSISIFNASGVKQPFVKIGGSTSTFPNPIGMSQTLVVAGQVTFGNLSTKGLVTNTAAGILGTTQGTGFIKDNGSGVISYDNSTYLTTTTAASTYLKLDASNSPLTGALAMGGNNITGGGTGAFTANTNAVGGITVGNSNASSSAMGGVKYTNNGSVTAWTALGSSTRSTYINIVANGLNTYTDNAAGMSFIVDANGSITWATNSTLGMTLSSSQNLTVVGSISGEGGSFVTTLSSLGDWHTSNIASATVTAGTGAGTGATTSQGGSFQDGNIAVTTGTLPTAAGTVVTVTFSGFAFPTNGYVTITPANALTAALSGTTMVYAGASATNSFSIKAGSVGLTAASVYSWNYHVGGF